MFLALVGYMIYFNVTKIDDLNRNQYNTKKDAQEKYVVRGSIVSADGEIIAGTNIDDEGNETRVYPDGNLFAHVVGYTTNGKSGLEAIYNNDLMTSNASIIERVGNEASNQKVKGDSLAVTLNSGLQRAASSALGAYRGAVIVMEPSTGKILAMVSKPDFNPNDMENEWEFLIAEGSRSPLLNRVTQGLYPPGSTFKIVTALEYLKEHPQDYTDYAYNCEGTLSKDDVTIKCYDYQVHGFEDLQASFRNSCNTSFANIGLSLDGDKFNATAKELLFNGDLPTILPYSESRFVLNGKTSVGDIMTTSIGQGDTLVSPFHMALITSAIANHGILMYPYLVDHIENVDGVTVTETKPMQYKRLMTSQEASILKSFMQSVVESGTATSLYGRGYTVAGKTGSAEYEVNGNTGDEANFSTHSWFVGFSNVENPDIVVCVIAEDGGTGSSAAVPIAGQIFDAYYYG
ncbi:MAG: penicillin-binding transpeptidase domain-containing protein [Eubacteriales bacterium]|nr:penicillin-binding transpeptidase domain-containing protein [Eubacteriales bacterium]